MDSALDTNDAEAMWDMFNTLKKDLDDEEGLNQDPESNDIHCSNPSCEGVEFSLEDGNYLCKKCNTIQERFIDYTPEWRYYGNDDSKSADPTRCGMPASDLLPGMSLGSEIGIESKYKNKQNGGYMSKIYMYHKWNSMSYKERNLYNNINSMAIKANNGNISNSIIEEAKVLYKRFSEMKISRGEKNREGLIATCIYMSCKEYNVPRSAKEIAKIFNLNITSMTKACKKFNDLMKTSHKTSTTPDDFIQRFCSKLDFSHDVIELCRFVVKKEQEFAFISENAPPSIAAGCIYLVNNVCKLGRTKKDISHACDISEITINKCYKKLCDYKSYLFPPGYVQ
jgi:transcription initiation factor TFIIB